MGIFEFDEDLYREAMQEDGIEIGKEIGQKLGEELGEARISQLYKSLCDEGRIDDLMRSTRDRTFQKELLVEYGL